MKCGICGCLLNETPDTLDCGGECLRCMAEIVQDPDSIKSISQLRKKEPHTMTKVMPIRNHFDNKIDHRYRVEKEFCGHPVKQYVARFCGNFIGSHPDYDDAVAIAQEYYDNHKIIKE